MKIEGFDWIDIASAVRVYDEPAPQAAHRQVRGAMVEVKPQGHGSVEYYLAPDGTLIRLENAEQCRPFDHASLLE